jgi:hypothetical protein
MTKSGFESEGPWDLSINNETVRVEPFDCAQDRLREAKLREVETPEIALV